MISRKSKLGSLTNMLVYLVKRGSWVWYPKRFVSTFDDVVIDRPVFFVGNQGGGLTLVSRMLRRHPLLVSISGDYTYWSGADEMHRVMMTRLPPTLRTGGAWFARDHQHPVYTSPRSWSYACDEMLPSYRNTAQDYDEKAAQKMRFLIREAVHRFGRGREGVRFTDKSQVYSVKMGYMDALLEGTNPHFVLISRNPYASIYRAAIGRAGDMRRYASTLDLDTRIEICTQHWCNAMRCVLEDSGKVYAFKAMRFEDFLHEPEASMRALCDFVGLDYSEKLLPQPQDVIPFGSRYSEKWYPLRLDVNGRYLNRVGDEVIARIAAHCGDIAEQLGYTPPGRVG